jgi:hypothetical protein
VSAEQENYRNPSIPRWTSMDVYEPLWMAPRAEFEIGLKHLMFNAPTSLMSCHTPSDTPALNP